MRVYHLREIGEIIGKSHETARKRCQEMGLTLPLSREELEKLEKRYTNVYENDKKN